MQLCHHRQWPLTEVTHREHHNAQLVLQYELSRVLVFARDSRSHAAPPPCLLLEACDGCLAGGLSL